MSDPIADICRNHACEPDIRDEDIRVAKQIRQQIGRELKVKAGERLMAVAEAGFSMQPGYRDGINDMEEDINEVCLWELEEDNES